VKGRLAIFYTGGMNQHLAGGKIQRQFHEKRIELIE
jgi:hypothetical protein